VLSPACPRFFKPTGIRFLLLAFTLLIIATFTPPLDAHLCDNVFRQADKLIIKPENYNLVVRDRLTFKIYLQNNMDRGIAEISLLAESPNFNFTITPGRMSIPKDQRAYFEVTMVPKAGTRSGTYPVNFRLVGGGREFKRFSLSMSGQGGGGASNRPSGSPATRPSTTPGRPAAPSPVAVSSLLLVNRAASVPRLDGQTSDPCWRSAAVASNFSSPRGGKAVHQTVALLCFDNTCLYLAVYCRDDQPQSLGARDRVTIKLSEGGATTYCITLPASGAPAFSRLAGGAAGPWSPAGFQSSIARQANGWTAECALPWSDLGAAPPKKRRVWNLRIERTKATGSGEKSYWAADALGYNRETGLGQFVIMP